ncbi:uncharacterized protein KGF55_004618 [Candida pseudojiufengensis]|uniref:uncharacterized protein n=1 Tax=Candida pseudojiufengensis TaxID=497109 RepID=UPI00222430E3|nr:uncharacterized protein KGF55_004618 [Candida pseudojiufengensis]KAI5960326.1 hypothetical protein KGF55_004618 [Candida pseudojiufengensis]
MGRHSHKKKLQLQQERERELLQQKYYGNTTTPYYQQQNSYQQQQQQPVEVPKIIPTEYEKPTATLKNFPSSIVNGITKEGGVFSLTLKSIHCVKYVENNDNMRRCFKKPILDIPRISNINSAKLLEQLQKELEAVKNEQIPSSDSSDITKLNQKLNNVAEKGVGIDEVNEEIRKKLVDSGNFKILNDKGYDLKKSKISVPLDVAKKEEEEVKKEVKPEEEKPSESTITETIPSTNGSSV